MFLNTKLNIVKNTMQDLAKELKSQSNETTEANIRSFLKESQLESSSWIIIDLQIKLNSVQFTPSLNDVVNSFTKLFSRVFLEYSKMHQQFLQK